MSPLVPLAATAEQVEHRLKELRLTPADADALLGIELSKLPPRTALLALDGIELRTSRTQWPGLEWAPDVCGGSARIAGTRIPVWTLEGYRRLGASEAAILATFPSLRAIDLVNAWQYSDLHPGEMDCEIRANETA